MAIKIGAHSSALNLEVAAKQLCQDITDGSLVVGAIDELNSVISDRFTCNNFPSLITCQDATDLSRTVVDLVERVAEWKLRLESEPISAIDGIARELLRTQFNRVNEQFEESKSLIIETLDFVIEQSGIVSEKTFPVFQRSVLQYLQTRDHGAYAEACKWGSRIETLTQTVAILTENKALLEGRTVKYPLKEELGQERIYKLQWLIGSDLIEANYSVLANHNLWGYNYAYTSVENACVILDAWASEVDLNLSDDDRVLIDDCIDDLQKQIGSDQVNYWVWELSGRKTGENYGEVHRYDDCGILKEAILCTARSLVDKLMNEKAVGLDREAVYGKVFEFIGEPEVENPMAWMKENACYYLPTLLDTIEKMKFSERQFEVIVPVQQSDWESENPEPKVTSILEDIKFSSPSKRATVDLSKNHPYTEVLTELSNVGDGPISSELRERIEKMISELSEKGQGETINYEVWRLGGEKAGENWGVVHRYDDPNVLRQALMIAARQDVHNEMFKSFANEEVLNAFYAQITAFAFGEGKIPSVDVVAYGKENIPFHLHQMARAKQSVMGSVSAKGSKLGKPLKTIGQT